MIHAITIAFVESKEICFTLGFTFLINFMFDRRLKLAMQMAGKPIIWSNFRNQLRCVWISQLVAFNVLSEVWFEAEQLFLIPVLGDANRPIMCHENVDAVS
jgi:hypothetical protein